MADFCTRKDKWKLGSSPSLLRAQRAELGKEVLVPSSQMTKEGLWDEDNGACQSIRVSRWPLLSCWARPGRPLLGLLGYGV